VKRASFVLDSSALIAYLEGEPGAQEVRGILEKAAQGQARVLMASVNYGECFYVFKRTHGDELAADFVEATSQLPLTLAAADVKLALAAGEAKARNNIPYVDAFAAALADSLGAKLLTCDQDFEAVSHWVDVQWIGRGPEVETDG
jgi:predicted nucleic acid-binding protein